MGIFDKLDQENVYSKEIKQKLEKYIDFWYETKDIVLDNMYNDFRDFFGSRDFSITKDKYEKRFHEIFKCNVINYSVSALKGDLRVQFILSGVEINDSDISQSAILSNTSILKIFNLSNMSKPQNEYRIEFQLDRCIPDNEKLEEEFDSFKKTNIFFKLDGDTRKFDTFKNLLEVLE